MRRGIVILFIILSTTQLGYSQIKNDSIKTETTEEVPLHIREIPRHNLMFDFGILQSVGDYTEVARSGLNLNLGYDYYLNNNFALSSSLRHAYNEFGISLDDQQDLGNDDDSNFSKTSIAAGFNFTLRENRFQFDTFLRGGIAFLNSPERIIGSMGDIVAFKSDPDKTASNAGYAELGVRFNYYFRKQVQLYFSPMYSTTFSEPVAFDLNGNKTVNPSNLHFNIGLKIALGRTYSNGEMRVNP